GMQFHTTRSSAAVPKGHNGIWLLFFSVRWTRSKSRGTQFPSASLLQCSLISAAERGQHWAAALAVIRAMFRSKVAEDIIVHNAAMSACEKCGRWEQALALLAALPCRTLAPDSVSFGTASAAAARAQQWEISIGLLHWAEELHFGADPYVRSTAIAACGQAQWPRGLEIFANGPTSRTAFNAILDATQTMEIRGPLFELALQRSAYPGLLKDGKGTLDLHELSVGAASAAVTWWLQHVAPKICATRDVDRL
ncbi:unnamed protein product, partial [Symbiodinium natans]